jgi:hypothetical protein
MKNNENILEDTAVTEAPVMQGTLSSAQSGVAIKTSSDETIRPFRFQASQADLDDLKRRILATRWPEKETVSDQTQGVPLATDKALAKYWATEYDWEKWRQD